MQMSDFSEKGYIPSGKQENFHSLTYYYIQIYKTVNQEPLFDITLPQNTLFFKCFEQNKPFLSIYYMNDLSNVTKSFLSISYIWLYFIPKQSIIHLFRNFVFILVCHNQYISLFVPLVFHKCLFRRVPI
jgi:hypothetical protein